MSRIETYAFFARARVPTGASTIISFTLAVAIQSDTSARSIAPRTSSV